MAHSISGTSVVRGMACIGVLIFYFVRLCEQSSHTKVQIKIQLLNGFKQTVAYKLTNDKMPDSINGKTDFSVIGKKEGTGYAQFQ